VPDGSAEAEGTAFDTSRGEDGGDATAPPIDPAAVQASFDRLTAILADMMGTVEDLSRHRCPYKDRRDRCTAQFGCRNQRRVPDEPDARRCAGDDRLDYRSAWETR
jgi:hypothetical protein